MADGTPLLAYNIWLSLPQSTRAKLTKVFSIPRTGEVIVRSGGMINGNIAGEITQDGHSAKDLYAITVEKMQTVLDTDDTDFYKMFNHIVENIDYLTMEKEFIAQGVDEELLTLKAHKEDFGGDKGPEIIPGEVLVIDPKEKAKFAKLMTPKKEYKKRRPKTTHEAKE